VAVARVLGPGVAETDDEDAILLAAFAAAEQRQRLLALGVARVAAALALGGCAFGITLALADQFGLLLDLGSDLFDAGR
jgi:hypothetical protein